MRKIVINKCYGGFCLSDEAEEYLNELGNVILGWGESTWQPPRSWTWVFDKDRCNLDLISVVEKLGERANGDHAELKVVEIPDDVEYIIQEYDGIEWVAETHRTWS
jgi:hypothetical protein